MILLLPLCLVHPSHKESNLFIHSLSTATLSFLEAIQNSDPAWKEFIIVAAIRLSQTLLQCAKYEDQERCKVVGNAGNSIAHDEFTLVLHSQTPAKKKYSDIPCSKIYK
jgi:hypothetical protein